MTLPASSVISATRFSHSSWSNGLTLALLKTRSIRNVFAGEAEAVFWLRIAATGAERRRRCFSGAEDKISSRASIIVSFFLEVLRRVFADRPQRKNWLRVIKFG